MTADPFANLEVFDPDLPHFGGQEAPTAPKQLTATLEGTATTRSKPSRRRYMTIHGVDNAADAIGSLPAHGEAVHIITQGQFAAFDLVPAIIRLADQPIRHLSVATLGFNGATTARLVDLVDAGQVQAVDFICSHWFRSVEKNAWTEMREAITQRGGRAIAARCHAKVIVADLAVGLPLVAEGSANLNASTNVEQVTLTASMALASHHRAWMRRLLEATP